MSARRPTPAEISLTEVETAMHTMFRATGIERRICWAILLKKIDAHRVEIALEGSSWKRAQEAHLMRHGIGFLEARS